MTGSNFTYRHNTNDILMVRVATLSASDIVFNTLYWYLFVLT
jgi:hypothetical protein